MSAGHGHKRDNHRHHSELKELLASGDAPQLMQRWQNLDVDHDVPDLAGYNVAGTTRYLDKDVLKALLDPEYAKQIGLEIDTGLSVDDTVECLLTHEGVEKVILDADNDVDTYLAAHELATAAEHEQVRLKQGSPVRYERGLKKAIEYCERKAPAKVAPDFSCASLLEDPDKHDKTAVKALKRLAISDAFKASRMSVDYSRSKDGTRCDGCARWLASDDTGPDLSRCAIVEGLVRADRWCKKFEPAQAETGGDAPEPQAQEGEGVM